MRTDNRDLVEHLVRQAAMPPANAIKVIDEILAYYHETTEIYVRRRHLELRHEGLSNSNIYEAIQRELPGRLFSATPHSERQIRRIIYG